MRLAEWQDQLSVSSMSMEGRKEILCLFANLGLGAMDHGSDSFCSFEIVQKNINILIPGDHNSNTLDV